DLSGGKVDRATVDMGEPILESEKIPTSLPGPRVIDQVMPHWRLGESWVEECGLSPHMTCVSMGNPHAIFFCHDVRKVPLEKVGPLVENAPIFPRKINAHFVQVQSAG